jgi:hypothetical protein
MPALGVPVDIDRDQTPNRFQLYLRLADALRSKGDASPTHLKELSDSFSHDILNLAVVASRLLWYEGVTPEMWRSHDLITVGVDAESYFVMLQSACDIMADVIATLGAGKKGQVPWESFHRLNEWAIKNPKRLVDSYQPLIGRHLPWFSEINDVRTKLVHRGALVWVYTERVTFEWDVFSNVPGSKVKRERYLLSSLKSLTQEMLGFSEALAAQVETEEERIKQSQKRVIEGVYVPALHHLFRYETPHKSEHLLLIAHCLLACGGYVEASYIGYPDGFWWQVVLTLAERATNGLVSADIHVNPSGRVNDCKFVFSAGSKQYGFIACDKGNGGRAWLEGASASAEKLQETYSLDRVAFAVRRWDGEPTDVLPDSNIKVIVGMDAAEVSRNLVAVLT